VDLHHHGDAETGPRLLDFAVNVYAGPRPAWLEAALLEGIAASSAYPDVAPARAALAGRHGRAVDEVLPTAGAAEACTLVARLRPWRHPVVVHPQFTEPHAALEAAGHHVTVALCRAEDGFRLQPAAVPADADLVVVGNPVNPTGVLHAAAVIRSLVRPGRLVVVDEAFLDAVPGEPETLAGEPGVLVLRSLTKHWSIPGIRAGYAIGEPGVIAGLAALQAPWSVSSPAIAAMVAIAGAAAESAWRARELTGWREHLETGLRDRGLAFPVSAAPFVLARAGAGVHAALRGQGVAVRRGGTFPGLDDLWVRIAARPPEQTGRLFEALDKVRAEPRA
jgi:cobyrinic acid a,c-diamide synthase